MRCGNCGRVSRQMGCKTVLCSLNPTAGRELQYFDILPAAQKKKVMIVGGGPAGMQAAITACQRGHEVDLYEKESELGGLLLTAMALPFKSDMRRSVAWLIRTTEKCGARIHLNTEVNAQLIREVNPDALIIAVGGRPFVPPIKGKDLPHVVWAGDIDTKRVSAGQNVAVIGAGLTGLECAIQLAKDGHHVCVADILPIERWCAEANPNTVLSLMHLLKKYQVELYPGAGVDHIEEDKVIINWQGQQREVPADTVAMATGMRSKSDVVEGLEGLVRHTWVVGDARRATNIMQAIHNGFQAAADI